MTNNTDITKLPANILRAMVARAFALVTECDGLARETGNALAWATTDLLVHVAGIAADEIVRDRYRHAVPAIVRPSWLTGGTILDESHVREQAVLVLCGWAHDRLMSAFAAHHEFPAALEALGAAL